MAGVAGSLTAEVEEREKDVLVGIRGKGFVGDV